MYKKVFLILCSIILLGVLASCGQDDYDDGYDNAPPPPNYISGRITLYNDTLLPIREIYLTPSSSLTWGSNKLSTDLLPGGPREPELWTFVVMIPDIFDLKVATVDAQSTYYAYRYDIPIRASYKVVLYAKDLDFTGSLEIFNDASSEDIVAIYVSPKGLNIWSPNQIKSGSILPGDSIQLLDIAPGSYDVMIEWSNGYVSNPNYSSEIISLTLVPLSVP